MGLVIEPCAIPIHHPLNLRQGGGVLSLPGGGWLA
jgi:hypothetical protein